MRPFLLSALSATLALALPAAAATSHFGAVAETASRQLTLWSSTDITVLQPLLSAFAAGNPGVSITYEDINTNELNARALSVCSGDEPAPDLLISSAIDLQVALVNEGCASPHHSAAVAALPDWARWRDEVFGLTFEPVGLVYNRKLTPFDGKTLSRFDLIDLLRDDANPYRDRIVTYDIAASGIGYLLAFADSLQAATYGRLIEALGRNGLVATCCANEIMDGVASGQYLIGYNIPGSYAMARARRDDRIGVLFLTDYTLVLSRAAIIPKGAPHADLAGAFIDFTLSAEGRQILTDSELIVDPDRAPSPYPGFVPVAAGDSQLRPIRLDPVLLAGLDREKRRIFLKAWRNAVPSRPSEP